jgi:hypothetical protein
VVVGGCVVDLHTVRVNEGLKWKRIPIRGLRAMKDPDPEDILAALAEMRNMTRPASPLRPVECYLQTCDV